MTSPHHNQPPLEVWRLKAEKWAELDAHAFLLAEGKSSVLSEMINLLVSNGASVASAEKEARASEKFRDYLKKMGNARKQANLARIDMDYHKEKLWESKNAEANARSERRMV